MIPTIYASFEWEEIEPYYDKEHIDLRTNHFEGGGSEPSTVRGLGDASKAWMV